MTKMSLPRLETAIDATIDNSIKELHTALPGQIVSFNSETQLASVQLQINRVFLGNRTVEIPKLINVPIVSMRGGGFSITFPISAGDECLVIFSERSIDNWLSTGQIAAPLHTRTHDFSDGIAIVGLYSQPNVITDFDSENFQIRNDSGTCSITITPDGVITIGNEIGSIQVEQDGSVTMGNSNALLTLYPNGKIDIKNLSSGYNLFTILSNLLLTLSGDGVNHDGFQPLIGQPTYATLKTQLDTFIS